MCGGLGFITSGCDEPQRPSPGAGGIVVSMPPGGHNTRLDERPVCHDRPALFHGPCPGPALLAPAMSAAPIGVFDSGVGGLSVLRHIHRMLPSESLIYVADSAYAPYGDRSSEEIHARAHAICRFLIDQGARAIVVACNTATAVAVASLRATFDLPIVAMEPAIKPAAALTQTGVVAVLATQRTLASQQIERLVQRHAQGCRVLLQPCPGFVDQVERGELTGARTRRLVADTLQPLLDAGIDVLVLGCTHYPFLLPAIRAVVGEDLTIIDPAEAVTQELQRRLTGHRSAAERAVGPATLRFYTTGSIATVGPVLDALWGRPAQLSGCLDAQTDTVQGASPAGASAEGTSAPPPHSSCPDGGR